MNESIKNLKYFLSPRHIAINQKILTPTLCGFDAVTAQQFLLAAHSDALSRKKIRSKLLFVTFISSDNSRPRTWATFMAVYFR